MSNPGGFLIGIVWGLVTIVTWTIVLTLRWRIFDERHDRRSARELRRTVPLWVAALLFTLVLLLALIQNIYDSGPAIRGILFGLMCGAFTGAGILAAFDVIREWKER